MGEARIHQCLAWGVIAIAVLTFGVLLRVTAPYGRHSRAGWGPTMPTRWAWVLMESPSVVVFVVVYWWGEQRLAAAPLLLLGLWLLHYLNRTLVYPFRIRTDGKRTALLVVALAIAFNVTNAYLNARQLSHFGGYPDDWLFTPQCLVGVALFLVGRHINMRADGMLIRLRERGGGYHLPRGWLFRYVSCPNYLGEAIQWGGFALASWSLAAASFAIFTLANLVPRALAHHRWYRQHFADYPACRRAWLPWLW